MTKAQIFTAAAFFILPPFLAVVGASFVQWQFSPFWEWTEEGRAMFLFVWMACGVFSIGLMGERQ